MRLTGCLPSIVAGCALLALSAPGLAHAAVPPDRDDPCARGGRDVCGTTGVGFYADSRYGVRWFGDFRGAVPGHPHAFCIDLRYWYASPTYRYRPTSAALRNRDGEPVTAARQARISYAIWRFGRSRTPRRQAATMLYVHALMDDGRPGELNPRRIGRRVATLYRRIARDATRFRGPYRVQVALPDTLAVGERATAAIRVRAASGRALPYVRLTLAATGADTPARVRTNRAGVAQVALTPTAVGVSLHVSTEPLATARPRVYRPTTAAAAANGQRLAVPAAARVAATADGRARPVLAATISRPIVRPDTPISENVTVTGVDEDTPAQVRVDLYGPFASREQIDCTGKPFRRQTVTATGGTVASPPVAPPRAGFYTYRVQLVGSPQVPGLPATGCGETSSTALAAPGITAGRGDPAATALAPGAGGETPVRVRIPALKVDAAVVPEAIDLKLGMLGLPKSIARVGWWRDGSAPGAATGTTLIAGHVDSAKKGAGAFFALRRAKRGAVVRVTTAAGRTHAYRVSSVRVVAKDALPLGIYSTAGKPRLVLVTCGGPFDEAARHYRDNVVVTAVPA